MDSFSKVETAALVPVASIPVPPGLLVTRDLAAVADRARLRIEQLVEQTRAASTRKAYDRDWRHFESWCAALGVSALPASRDTVLAYLSELPTMENSARHGRGLRKSEKTGYSVATIERRAAVVALRHKESGLDNPCAHEAVRRLLRGIRREVGTAPLRKAALVTENFRRLRRTDDESVQAVRDRAMLLVGFSGAFRRSEVCGLNLEDLEWHDRTLTCHLRRSKTDQEGRGRQVVIHAGAALCPIAALRRWLEVSGIQSGALFRSVRKGGAIGPRLSTEGLSQIVKRHAAAVGLNADDYGAHSLRSGHVTTAILRGESAHSIMAVTGHRSRAMVDRYFREVEPRRHNSSASLGL